MGALELRRVLGEHRKLKGLRLFIEQIGVRAMLVESTTFLEKLGLGEE